MRPRLISQWSVGFEHPWIRSANPELPKISSPGADLNKIEFLSIPEAGYPIQCRPLRVSFPRQPLPHTHPKHRSPSAKAENAASFVFMHVEGTKAWAREGSSHASRVDFRPRYCSVNACSAWGNYNSQAATMDIIVIHRIMTYDRRLGHNRPLPWIGASYRGAIVGLCTCSLYLGTCPSTEG